MWKGVKFNIMYINLSRQSPAYIVVFILLLSLGCCATTNVTNSTTSTTTTAQYETTRSTAATPAIKSDISSLPQGSDQDVIADAAATTEAEISSTIETNTRLIEYDAQKSYQSESSTLPPSPPSAPIESSSPPFVIVSNIDVTSRAVVVADNSSQYTTHQTPLAPIESPTSAINETELEPTETISLASDGSTHPPNEQPTLGPMEPLDDSHDDMVLSSSSPKSTTEVRQVSSTPSAQTDGPPSVASVDEREESSEEFEKDQSDGGPSDEVIKEKLIRASRSKDKEEEEKLLDNLLAKKPFGQYMSVEQKWSDIFMRFFEVQRIMTRKMSRMFFKDMEHYMDIGVSPKCLDDITYARNYGKKSNNTRWLMRMFDSFGKPEAGLLAGNVPNLGHVQQCIRVRAPDRFSNDSFDERDFELQTEALGERFRGKYCLVTIRPIMPPRPKLVSRYRSALDLSLLSNVSYMGQLRAELELRKLQYEAPPPGGLDQYSLVSNQSKDYVPPFESPLYQMLIDQNAVMYTFTRMMGVCYPSSCTRDDIAHSIQKSFDEYHQLVTLEHECEQEPVSISDWMNTPRAVALFMLATIVSVSLVATFLRIYILAPTSKKGTPHTQAKLGAGSDTKSATKSSVNGVSEATRDLLNLLSMDKCTGYLFIKTRPASTMVDKSKLENDHRSTSVDALKGFLMLMLIYSQLVTLGCLPVPFLWARWTDAMGPFYRSPLTQLFLSAPIWTESFYFISGYLVASRLLQTTARATMHRLHTHGLQPHDGGVPGMPSWAAYVGRKYIGLVAPMLAMIFFNYVWPHLSNGFVLTDQANKLQAPCDKFGWTNMLLFHNHGPMNETCLWPSHVSAVQFQLHLLAYPVVYAMAYGLSVWLRRSASSHGEQQPATGKPSSGPMGASLTSGLGACTYPLLGAIVACLAAIVIGMVYPAWLARREQLIVPFLIDYPDYFNYERVIEWIYMPTYNHLTSYFMGLLVALLVVYHNPSGLRPDANPTTGPKWHWSWREEPVETDRQHNKSNNNSTTTIVLANIASVAGIVLALTVTLYWCAFDNEMTATHTFVYVLLAKLAYLLPFSWLFYRYVATHPNSDTPWMLTRFLVPLGRMSASIYYTSWLVVWFELLASPHQWHPSHYFVAEKYLELVLLTLFLAIVSHGFFEGPIKALHYTSLRAEVRPRNEKKFQKAIAGGQKNMLRIVGCDVVIVEDHSQESGVGVGARNTTTAGGGGMGRLSIVDQKKLNAELRANTSFASLSNLSNSSSMNITGNNSLGASTTTLVNSADTQSQVSTGALVRLCPTAGAP